MTGSAADGLVYYAHDALGRRTALTDQQGNTSYFDYDAASRLVSELDPLGNATYYQYDPDGNLIARTDGEGETAYFDYDAVGRQIAAKYGDVEAVYFTYDLAGNRTLMLDEWGATYWTYDPLGRPTSRHDPRGSITYYAYGAAGQRTQLTVHGHGTVYYGYDVVGRMERLLDGKTDRRTYYEYDPVGRVTRQHHPNATTTYFSYDPAGRLSEKLTVKDADNSVLVRFAYTRDAAGNPIAIERESGLGTFYYEYDALQRLAYEGQFVDAARRYENYYEYDGAGNRSLLRHGETVPETLYVQGISAGVAELTFSCEVEETGASYPPAPAHTDTVKFTVVDVTDVAVHASDPESAEIQSVLGADGLEHFVTAKDQGDVVLVATVVPDTQDVIDRLTWHTTAGVGITCPAVDGDRRTASFSSHTADGLKVPLTIKVDGSDCHEAMAWVVWVALSADCSTQTSELDDNNEHELAQYPPSPPHLGLSVILDADNSFCSAIEWRGTIQPEVIVAHNGVSDVPDLDGTLAEPGADHFWDMSRERRRRYWIDGVETGPGHPDPNLRQELTWIGDDAAAGDEDNNPYDGPRANPQGPATRQIFSYDNPAFDELFLNAAGATLAFGWKKTYREFARIYLGGKWYRCSDYGNWRSYRAVKKDGAIWVEDPAGDNVIDDTHTGW